MPKIAWPEKSHGVFGVSTWPIGCDTPSPFSGCRKRSAAKGVRSLFFVFGTLSVTFRSLFLTLLSLFSSLFCQTPFAGISHWAAKSVAKMVADRHLVR